MMVGEIEEHCLIRKHIVTFLSEIDKSIQNL